MNAEQAASRLIELAAKHDFRNDSARLALRDARATWFNGRYDDACGRALASLAHSVGVFNPDYIEATLIVSQVR